MAKEGTLLIVDDNRSILAALRLLLEKYFARVLTLPTPNRLATTLREEQIDVILLDMNFTAGINTGNEGIYWLSEIHARRPDIKVVLFTAYADIDLAVRAMRDGAVDFVVKPWDNDRLVASLRNAYNLARSAREVKQLKEIKRELASEQPMFWGESPAMARIREIVEKVAATDANILITGENGTGKEMLAREIHNRSARSGELMVSVDMGAVPETLFESELFGHVKGAFTDARADRAGKFEVADHGTLFLDEIGNLPYDVQVQLLRAIQERVIRPVGSVRETAVDVRIIAATNENLLEAIRFAAVELKPYLPDTADKIFAQLGVENKGVESLTSFDGMQPGQPVGEASILFERIDIPKKLAEIEEEKKAAEAEQKPAVEFLPDIPFDDFCKVDMTVCKVLACENVKKSNKLLKFQLDDGSGTPRQILSGIAKYYKPEELVGKTVVAVTNLPPRKMMGQESNGMLLSAEKDEKLNLLMLDDSIPAGAKLC